MLAGCSLLRRTAGKSGTITPDNSRVTPNTLINNNITNGNFYISRVDVEVNNKGEQQKFLATIRYKEGEGYLISLRSRTGFEAARIFLGPDTLLINDRLNRALYYGNPDKLKNIIGYSGELFPLIFGDILLRNLSSSEINCTDSKGQLQEDFSGYRIGYEINCNIHKVAGIIHENSLNKEQIRLSFQNFSEENGRIYPHNATIISESAGSSISLLFNQIEFEWQGALDFVPGSNYERIELR